MNESQVIGSKITQLENWFRQHPGNYDPIKRDELRTLYSTLGDETKSLEQSDIILANQVSDGKTMQLLSESASDNDGAMNVMSLLGITKRFPQFEYVRAAVRIRAADLFAANGQTKVALATYQLVFNGPANYARLAKEKYRNLTGSKASAANPDVKLVKALRQK